MSDRASTPKGGLCFLREEPSSGGPVSGVGEADMIKSEKRRRSETRRIRLSIDSKTPAPPEPRAGSKRWVIFQLSRPALAAPMQPSRDEFHHRSPTPDPRGMPKRPRTRSSIDPYLYINQINAGFQIACPEIGRRRH